MDLLFKKYASPFLLLDSYIAQGRLFEFILEFFKIRDEETTWEVWLYKVHDKSFEDFKKSLEEIKDNKEFTKEQIETTVTNSKDILSSFNPE